MSGAEKEKSLQLLADIEEFSRNGPAVSRDAPKETIQRDNLSFPDLGKSSEERKVATTPAASTAAPAAGSPPAGDAAAANSLLARLKQQANSMQKDAGQRDAQLEFRAKLLSAVLGSAFHYLDDLIKQLNIIKPPIPKDYTFPGNIVFSGMSWVEGAADFRMVPSASDDRRYDSVTARFRIASGQKIVLDRENIGIEPLRKNLHDYGVTFSIEEKFNARNQPDSARFTLPCEIKAGFLIKADYEAGTLLLRTRNIDRFGMMEFKLGAEDLNQESLDELTHLILGEKSRFLQMFRRSA